MQYHHMLRQLQDSEMECNAELAGARRTCWPAQRWFSTTSASAFTPCWCSAVMHARKSASLPYAELRHS